MSTSEKNFDLIQSNEILDLFGNLQAFEQNAVAEPVINLSFPANGQLKNNEVCFYKVKQLSFDEDYPHREAFENVLLSMNNEAFNFVYVLTGTEEGIELCLGVVQNHNPNHPVLGKKLSAVNYGEIIANVFEGNFGGSKLEKLPTSELNTLIGSDVQKYKNAGTIIGIPSINKRETSDKYDFQGIDRLINSMLGLEWRLVVVCEPVPKNEILELREDVYELYNRLSLYSKRTFQHSDNEGKSFSFGKNESTSTGRNWSYNKSETKSDGTQGESWNKSTQKQSGNSEGQSRDSSKGTNQGFSMNRGSTSSVTVEIANKHAEELMKYINEDVLERLKAGFSKGLFKSSIYYMAKEPTHANRLRVGIMSLFQGNNSTYSPLHAQHIDLSQDRNINILKSYQNQYVQSNFFSNDALLLLGRPFYENKFIGLSSYLTTDEISLIAGLPQKEVPGLSLREGVGFGLNEKKMDKSTAINLGIMVQKGRELKNIPFYLSRDSLSKHTFIAGVTGSGKTTTCHRLLTEANTPFLVIEPAKTEYRTLIHSMDDLVVLTLGNETVAPFRINPFELIKGEVISAHIDMIKATFTSAFPMEASMPQILEEAIIKCYEKKGWNINKNTNEKFTDAFDPAADSFPIMSDLLAQMKEVVESKHFSPQMQADYNGSLVSRLSNLTVGAKGNMLNCQHSTDFDFLIKHNIILEMEELKSPEDKSLFMGFVLSRLSAVIKNKHKEDPDYRHITLVEEAHRLLSKVEYGDSGSKKAAVETFTDLLAEVRKYGEGLIIVDQIPNKLASEVLKNTNTKIIHKIFAKDDKEAVGDTMLMDSRQKEYLSALRVGDAIVFSEHTDKPVHVHITAVSNTNEGLIDDKVVEARFKQFKKYLGVCYKEIKIVEILPQYAKVANLLSRMTVDEEEFNLLKRQIENIHSEEQMETEGIWELLIKKYDINSGKSNMSQIPSEDRISALKDFFTKDFYKDNFSEDDIFNNRNICTYLK